jgi:hypothetical protein
MYLTSFDVLRRTDSTFNHQSIQVYPNHVFGQSASRWHQAMYHPSIQKISGYHRSRRRLRTICTRVDSLHKNQNIMDTHEYDLTCATHTDRTSHQQAAVLPVHQRLLYLLTFIHVSGISRCHPSFKLAWTSLYLAWLCTYANLNISSHGHGMPCH